MSTAADYSLAQADWPALAQAVKERWVLHMQTHMEDVPPPRVRLVVSLCLIPDAPRQSLTPLLDWLVLQTPRIEITASRHASHTLRIG